LTQAPDEHDCIAPQAVPQAPQFFTSVAVDTQLPLHSVLPAGHRQVPSWHAPPGPQVLPQAPQLFGSNWVKVHAPLQVVWPGRHCAAQVKPLHTWPAAHALPQPPQLFGSSRDTQVPLQSWSAPVHWQLDWLQLPPPHDVPHAPQLPGSVAGFTHTPLHVRYPGGQPCEHAPLVQVWPAAHAFPQAPQFLGSLAVVVQAPLHSA
jgi:hypothetical protein